MSWSYPVDKKRKVPLFEIPRIQVYRIFWRLKNRSFPRKLVKGLDVLAFSLRGRNIAVRTLVAVGDVVVECRRWQRNVQGFCRRGFV